MFELQQQHQSTFTTRLMQLSGLSEKHGYYSSPKRKKNKYRRRSFMIRREDPAMQSIEHVPLSTSPPPAPVLPVSKKNRALQYQHYPFRILMKPELLKGYLETTDSRKNFLPRTLLSLTYFTSTEKEAVVIAVASDWRNITTHWNHIKENIVSSLSLLDDEEELWIFLLGKFSGLAREDAKEELQREAEIETQKRRDLDIVRLVEKRSKRRTQSKRDLWSAALEARRRDDSTSSSSDDDLDQEKMDDLHFTDETKLAWMEKRSRKRKDKARQTRWQKNFPKLGNERLTFGTFNISLFSSPLFSFALLFLFFLCSHSLILFFFPPLSPEKDFPCIQAYGMHYRGKLYVTMEHLCFKCNKYNLEIVLRWDEVEALTRASVTPQRSPDVTQLPAIQITSVNSDVRSNSPPLPPPNKQFKY